jgi:hypothetical protein
VMMIMMMMTTTDDGWQWWWRRLDYWQYVPLHRGAVWFAVVVYNFDERTSVTPLNDDAVGAGVYTERKRTYLQPQCRAKKHASWVTCR